ncbi:hypothetical protein ACQI5H_15120 [Mycobacterium heidelbergense]|uniref:hypothetical protein n=1 Tax=Mycobacterium heidelbergense TaxID=53376 RepID=UPI003CF30A00
MTTSHAIGMSDAAASARIEEDYAGSRPYQHQLEIIRNATQQDGTTYIASDVVALPGTGALKRATINNGPALTEPQLSSYMTTIGAGDGDIWRLHNTLGQRHAGARTSVLPWTDLLVLSWDADEIAGGLAMKLFKGPATSEYEYTPVFTPEPALLQVLTGRPEVQKSGHGVAFIYLGRNEHKDGPFVDPNPDKHETPYGIVDAMRDRIYEPVGIPGGQPIIITVSALMPAAQGKSFGGRKLTGAGDTEYRLDSRTIQGHGAWTDRPSVSGTVVVDDDLRVGVKWTLLPFPVKPDDRRLPYGGKGHVIARYKNEAMVLAAPGGDYPDLAPMMRLFGVQLGDVYNRLCLEIVGPTDPGNDPANPRLHLHQDPTRSKLVLSNGKELPLAQWGERFIERMPQAILDANKAARERISSANKINLTTADRLTARWRSRINAVIQSRRRKAGTGVLGHSGAPGADYLDGMLNTAETVPSGDPSSTGVEGVTSGGTARRRSKPRKKSAKRRAPHVTPTGTSNVRRRTPASEKATEVQPRPAPVPEPAPLKEADWIRQEFDPNNFASWDAASGVVYFNLGHPILCNQNAYFTGEWLEQNIRYRRRVQAEDVRDAILQAYEEDTIGRIMHVVAERGLIKSKEQLTDEVLTIGAHGFENVEAKIEEFIRKSAGRGVVAAGAA